MTFGETPKFVGRRPTLRRQRKDLPEPEFGALEWNSDLSAPIWHSRFEFRGLKGNLALSGVFWHSARQSGTLDLRAEVQKAIWQSRGQSGTLNFGPTVWKAFWHSPGQSGVLDRGAEVRIGVQCSGAGSGSPGKPRRSSGRETPSRISGTSSSLHYSKE